MSDNALFDIDEPTAPAGWVYVIGPARSSVVKIGTGKDVKKRLASIQTGHPEVLVARWYTPGDRTLEDALHAKFRHLRKAGEWFDFGDLDPVVEVRAAVKELAGSLAPDPSQCLPSGAPESLTAETALAKRREPVAEDGCWTASEAAEYIGASSTGSARKTLSRWGVESRGYRASALGRAQAMYDADEVRAAKARRPGRGSRTDLAAR